MRLAGKKREAYAGYLFIMPNFIGFLLFSLMPVLASILISFTDWNISGSFKPIGLDNYKEMFFSDTKFYTILWNTIYFSLMYVPLVMIAALGLALLTNNGLKAATGFRFMYFLPVVTSAVAAAMVFQWLYNKEFGLLNYILNMVGLPKVAWLTDRSIVMFSVVIVNIWKNAGRLMVIYFAGLQAIPVFLYEAADIDGANWLNKFFKITLPSLSPTTFFILITSVIDSFQVFEIVFTLTGGGPIDSTRTLVTYIYDMSFTRFKMGYACALSDILFVLIFIFTLVQFKFQKKWVQSDY